MYCAAPNDTDRKIGELVHVHSDVVARITITAWVEIAWQSNSQAVAEAEGLALWTHPIQNIRLAIAVKPLFAVEAQQVVLDVFIFGMDRYDAVPSREAR